MARSNEIHLRKPQKILSHLFLLIRRKILPCRWMRKRRTRILQNHRKSWRRNHCFWSQFRNCWNRICFGISWMCSWISCCRLSSWSKRIWIIRFCNFELRCWSKSWIRKEIIIISKGKNRSCSPPWLYSIHSWTS